jgi:hypothetical protein
MKVDAEDLRRLHASPGHPDAAQCVDIGDGRNGCFRICRQQRQQQRTHEN